MDYFSDGAHTLIQDDAKIESIKNAATIDTPTNANKANEMKPNSVSFYLQGQKSARMGNTRSPGNEYRMPVFGEGKSWQAKSFALGFTDECAKMGRKVLRDTR